jgi:predicted transposase YbfD/YdcC
VPSSSPTMAAPGVPAGNGAGDLLTALRAVPDPRPGGARRHPTAFVLGVLVVSFASPGFESFSGAAQWAAAADQELLLALGGVPDPLTGQVHPPSEATIRRVTCGVDTAAFEAVAAAWTAPQLGRADPEVSRRAVAIDGKTVRGARTGDRPAPHLLAACTHPTHEVPAVVLAQRQIPGKTNEIPMVAALVGDLRAAGHDPATIVFTLDALHTQHRTATLLDTAGAGYLLTVKGNQPGLRTAIRDRVNAERPPRTSARSRGHGRTEERFIEVVPATGITFPGATQIFRITRYTGGLDGQRERKEVVHGITNLTATEADDARLAQLVRGHWAIENSIHWVRDMTYREDAHRARTGNAPAVLACIRNLVTTALRLAGAVNIAAARRAAALKPATILRLLHRPPKPDKPSM